MSSFFLNNGIQLAKNDQNEQAIIYFDRTIEASQNEQFLISIANGLKAQSLQKLNKFDEALMCYDKCIEFDPNDSDIYFKKGITQLI